MATSLTLENDSSLAQGYIKVNGSTAATLTTSGITGNLTGNADTATKLSTTTGSAPAYACRAWVNFDGTRDTTGAVSTANTNRLIRSSGNVTNVLRNGNGSYTVNFTTPMTDTNFSVSGACSTAGGPYVFGLLIAPNTATSVSVSTTTPAGAGIDVGYVAVQIFGN